MLRKSAAHQMKVDSAIQVLETTTGVKVPWAMIPAGFSKSDIANKIVRQQVRRRLALKLCHDRMHHDQTLLVAIIVPPVAVVVLPVALLPLAVVVPPVVVPPVAFIVPPVALLPLAVVMPPVVVPSVAVVVLPVVVPPVAVVVPPVALLPLAVVMPPVASSCLLSD